MTRGLGKSIYEVPIPMYVCSYIFLQVYIFQIYIFQPQIPVMYPLLFYCYKWVFIGSREISGLRKVMAVGGFFLYIFHFYFYFCISISISISIFLLLDNRSFCVF